MTTKVLLDELVAEFKEFAGEWDEEIELAAITPDQNLFDAGVLDSFKVARVIVLLEKLRGAEIELEGVSIESFSTLALMHRTFLQEGGSHAED